MKSATSLRFALLLLAITASLSPAPSFAHERDNKDCAAKPAAKLFTPFPQYYNAACTSTEFDSIDFPTGKTGRDEWPKEVTTVEGAVDAFIYVVAPGATEASALQMLRNFENAVKTAGGSVVMQYAALGSDNSLNLQGINKWITGGSSHADRAATFKLTKAGKETWVLLAPIAGGYKLVIAQREAMQQTVQVNELIDKINKDGFIALYINFDTDKSTIKPDSNKTLDDVAAALKSAPTLNLEVAGHTDNVGAPDHNQKLSEDRAKSVMAALVQRGVAAARLTAKGYGQTSPVADNRSEDGRAKNRRVELVKK